MIKTNEWQKNSDKQQTSDKKIVNLKLSDKTGYTLFLMLKLYNHSYHNLAHFFQTPVTF